MTLPTNGTLHGLRVLDLGTMIAGPFCCTLLADHGADVIKIEHPKHGDPLRSWAPMVNDISLWWKVIARNKRLITLDLSAEMGRRAVLELARTADVVVENFRPGTMERWGLSLEDLQTANPRIILVRISGYGQTGPYSSRPGYGTVAEAMSGIPSFTGFPDGPPQLSAFPLADYIAALFGSFAAMAAVYNRTDTGMGQEVDISLFEPLFRLVEAQVIGYDSLGIVKKRIGNRLEEDAPRNAYETRDGEYVTVSASSPRTWERFADAIGRPDLIANEKFRTNAVRCKNADELDAIVAAWHKERPLSEILSLFLERGVVAGPVYDIEDIMGNEHYQSREAIVQVADPELGVVKMQGVVPKFSRSPGSVRHPGLSIGQHNEEIFLDELQMSKEDFKALRDSGVV